MIRETKQGSGVYHVIGGAGGKLNYLKLRGVKSEKEYRAEAAQRQTAKRDQRAEQRKRDKEAGTYQSKQAEKKKVTAQRVEHEQRYIRQVAKTLGWEQKDLALDEDKLGKLSKGAHTKARRDHHRALLKRANEAVEGQRKRLLADAEARAQGGLGLVKIDSDPDEISTQDLDPVRHPTSGLGYQTDYAKRSGDVSAEAQTLKREQRSPEQQNAIAKRRATAEAIAKEMDGLDLPVPPPARRAVEASEAVALLKAHKQLKAVQRKASAANRAIDADEEPKAFVIEVGGAPSDTDIDAGLTQDLATTRTRSFLVDLREANPDYERELARHTGAGAYNTLASASLVAANESLIDRSAMDVLGIAGAAQVLARRLHNDLGDAVGDIAAAAENYHLEHHLARSKEAMDTANQWRAVADAIHLEAGGDGDDLAVASEMNRRRQDALSKAQAGLATALGEFEAGAALAAALKAPAKDRIEISLGRVTAESAIQQARAIGLTPGDYQVHGVGANQFLEVTAAGMDKLARPIDRAEYERGRLTADIVAGKHDEDDWLPLGVARRPDLALATPPGVAPSLAEPLRVSDNPEQSLRDYIGGRSADGDTPADIIADLQSLDLSQQWPQEQRQGYFQAINALVPTRDANGKLLRAEAHTEAFQAMADAFVADRYGGQRAPINRQRFTAGDKTSVEALHRALGAHPAGVAAFKPIGELTHHDQRALRKVFAKTLAHADPKASERAQALADIQVSEPEKETDDMFGRGTNPAWVDWKTRRDEAAEALHQASLSWPDYVRMLGQPAAAYATLQDKVRSDVSEAFHGHYNRLNSDAPLKLGRTVVRNNLRHLDAVDPAAREKRLAETRDLADRLRDRVAGRYASGSVAHKMEASREAGKALEQAQMGFFAAAPEEQAEKPLAADERHTLGHAAERQIGAMMGVVGKNFVPGQTATPLQASMSGDKVLGQRAVKLIDANKRVVLGLGTGSGKAQPLDAKVLTPSGWKAMGDLQVNDSVIAVDGKPTRVTGVYPQGEKEIYRVTMSDGASTECCADHLWETQTRRERKNHARGTQGCAGSPRSTLVISQTLLGQSEAKNHTIPIVGAVEFARQPLPVAPYLMGVLLGDGGLSQRRIGLSNPEPEILGRVADELPPGVRLRKCAGDSCDYAISTGVRGGNNKVPNAVLRATDALGLQGKKSLQKFIPDVYKFNGVTERLELLRGLMDTDGCAECGEATTFSSSSHALALDVLFLVRSLGGTASMRSKMPGYTYNGEHREGARAYILQIKMPPDMNPFWLPRKADAVVPKSKYPPRRFIVSVEPVGRKPAQCIRVEHPRHLYVTDDLIVTHNTVIGLGAYTHLHEQGKAKKGLFLVPSAVQGQFGAEALKFLEPGKYQWHAEPGASRADRIAHYKNPDTNFSVVTPQTFRDDMAHLAAEKIGGEPALIHKRMDAMAPGERAKFMRDVLGHHGIGFDYVNVDEGDVLLNRRGKDNSRMANMVDAVTDNAEYYVSASADPVRNDVSEVHDLLRKMDPARYADRAEFMRRYGVDTEASRQALRRELSRYVFAGHIHGGHEVKRRTDTVALSKPQQRAVESLKNAAADGKLARLSGKVDLAAMKKLSPATFARAPEDAHERLAKRLQSNIGIVAGAAIQRAIDAHPDGAKAAHVAKLAGERKGRAGVVFAHSLAAVESIAKRLEGEGHRVLTITGKDSAKDKSRKKLAFRPDGDAEPEADIIVASDAAAAGMNLQRADWLVQTDIPQTARTHAQRNGRIDRLGQGNPNIELIDIHADHPQERRNQDRLTNKYGLREIVTSPYESLDDTGLASYINAARAMDRAA